MNNRIQSIDLLRGIAMVIMALDHVRDYFHQDAYYFSPTDLDQTNVALFFTRFITNVCAPVFCFLAGTSAFFVGQKKEKRELSKWLVKRGLWLIFLEFTVLTFAWYFNIILGHIDLSVIWCLGASMIFLAAIIHLPTSFALPLFLSLVIGHNLFDHYQPAPDTFLTRLWMIFHIEGSFLIGDFKVNSVYPLLPWISLMACGYYFGNLYTEGFDQTLRKKILVGSGSMLVVLFLVLRVTNLYGDLYPWEQQPTTTFSILSILNVTKYPPSFLFLAITLGPAFIFLAYAEKIRGRLADRLVVIGQVPMFFYIVHIYVIHLVAMAAVTTFGFPPSAMVFDLWIGVPSESHLKGYGYSLPVVHLIWLALVIGLYPLCAWYRQYRKSHPEQWWLSYV